LLSLSFLGTGNFVAPGNRYWNGLVASAEQTVLIEPSPTALPNLRKAGYRVAQLDVVVVSHFHPDHTFGWPFLLFEALHNERSAPLHVVGPPGTEEFFASMMALGSVERTHRRAHEKLDIRYVEADGSAVSQSAGSLRFKAVRVEHVPELECFGYTLELGGVKLGYSGDTRPCPGLDELASRSDVLVVECNSRHEHESHMDVDSVRQVKERFPDLRMLVTHLGADVDSSLLPGIEVAEDLQNFTLGG
jgi:ribonuclease Z